MAAEAVTLSSSSPYQIEPLLAGLEAASHIALAVSGGSDSIALLRLTAAWATKFSVRLSILTVDHGLRPASKREAEEVGRLADMLGLFHETLSWVGEKPRTGIQAKARVVRYDLLTRWCVANGASHILTGHTLDDQAETVFMRRQRSSQPASLAAIRQSQSWHNGIIIVRPLLHLRRTALQDYCRALGQRWVDDPSNADERFERVRVRAYLAKRHELIEPLSEIAAKSLAETQAAERHARDWLKAHLTFYPWGYGEVARPELLSLPDLVQQHVMQELLMLFGLCPAGYKQHGDGPRPDASAVQRLLAWLRTGALSRRTLGGAVVAARKALVLVGRDWGRIGPVASQINADGKLIWDQRFHIAAPVSVSIVPAGMLKSGEWQKKQPELPDFVCKALPVIVNGAEVSEGQAALYHGVGLKFIRCLR